MLERVAKRTSTRKPRRKAATVRKTVSAAKRKRAVASSRASRSKPPVTNSKTRKTAPTAASSRAPTAAPSRSAAGNIRLAASSRSARSMKHAPTGPQNAEAALSPQIAAAIALALHDEEAVALREHELTTAPSPWTLAGRARRMQTRWTR
jgi:hypothetical protein